jgi:hypothetical protein
MLLRHRSPPHRRVTVPNHKEIAKGTLRAIIRETGLKMLANVIVPVLVSPTAVHETAVGILVRAAGRLDHAVQ